MNYILKSRNTIIAIFIFFLLAVIILLFSGRSALEKCADDIFLRGVSGADKGRNIKELLEMSLKEKSKSELWLSYYRDCENMKSKTPSSFKLEYGR